MRMVTLSYVLNEDLGLKSISFDYNDTGLEENSGLLRSIAFATIEALVKNDDSVKVQYLLNELGIERLSDKE